MPIEASACKVPRCPTCGTHYSIEYSGLGCGVCQFRRILELETSDDEGQFDQYELEQSKDGGFEELGRGAMGVTYKAFDTVLECAVALKVIDARIASRPEAKERFLREARAAARLRHPNVATVFYYGVRKSDGQCFYAMELVEGETLEARLQRAGPLPAVMALEVISQVARALVAAKAKGLVHRDLKPSNLMLALGQELIVKLIDFGLAQAVADKPDLTHGRFVGTPAFASPEQCAGHKIDIRSDLYSLGVVLWEMVTGQLPFKGSAAEVVFQHQHAPLPLDQLAGVPQPVVVLIEALLEKDPRWRLQSPAALLSVISTITEAIDGKRTITDDNFREACAGDPHAGRKRSTRAGPRKISIARLPVTGSEIFGRDEDIAFLDSAWADQKVNVVTIVAWAGVGKSTLVKHWLRGMAAEHYRSAELVYGWSFYRQGSSGGSSSADEFLDTALAWFGDSDPRVGTAWEKGERLAKLIADHRTLLVLDGLEPLQNPPGPQEGRVREPALQALLRELAGFNTGLCIITTRMPVVEIVDHERTSAPRRDLEQLSNEAGAKLLGALGVKGHEAELQTASNEFRGHCLALTLLGSYLTDAYGGDIRCRKEVSQHLTHDVRQGAHARNVMESYQVWFGEGPELSVLRILGLFDRPADEKALEALLGPPIIRGLTEPLANLSSVEWRTLLAQLRRANLLGREDPHNPGQLDTHPLIREYFGEQLRSRQPEAWRECNRRLYEFYRTLAPALPDSFQEMEPLFLAVVHGCNAGLFRQALHEVYIPRIQRGEASFAANVLGVRGALLFVLAHFFKEGRWGSLMESGANGHRLTAEDQLFLLLQAALHLTATRGHSAPEARSCYERAETLCRSLNRPLLLYVALLGQWHCSLLTDRLSATLQVAERVYALALEQNDSAQTIAAYRALAATHHFMGDFAAARKYAMCGLQIWRSGGLQSYKEDLDTSLIACLCYAALSEWHFGEIASSYARMAEARSLAKELHDKQALVAVLHFAAILAQLEQKPAEVERLVSDLVELSMRHNFAVWLALGEILRGWARSASGNTKEGIAWIEDGIRDYRATGSMLRMPHYLVLKAEALYRTNRTSEALETLEEAETVVEKFEERGSCAELYRLRGVFLAAIGADEIQVVTFFRKAIATANQQKSISLARRAESTYAAYRRGKP